MGQVLESPAPAVRRSPLEGARRGEAVGHPLAVGLAEIGPYDKLLVLGPDAAKAVGRLFGVEMPPQTVHVGAAPGLSVEVWLLAPDEALLLIEAGDSDGSPTIDVASQMSSDDVSVVDVGSAWTVLRVTGAGAPGVLAELITVDVDPRTLPPNGVVQGPLAGIRAVVARRDTPTDVGYTILVARDYASYAWGTLLKIGTAQGLRPASPVSITAAGPQPIGESAGEPAR